MFAIRGNIAKTNGLLSFWGVKNRYIINKFSAQNNKLFLQGKSGQWSGFATVTNQTTPLSIKSLSESFIDGTSAAYVEQMYAAWKKDPSSVHVSWASYFTNMDGGAPPGKAYMSPPTLYGKPTFTQVQAGTAIQGNVKDIVAIHSLIDAYQRHGHFLSQLDPLNFYKKISVSQVDPKSHGFSELDLDREFQVDPSIFSVESPIKLRDLITKLQNAYCKTVGVEFMHIINAEERNWIRSKFEGGQKFTFSKEEKVNILDRLLWADGFEKFLGTKYNTDKRFGLDGCEIMIPGMKAMIDRAAELGVSQVVIGMPHRGRLNVLANVVKKPLEAILNEFTKKPKFEKEPDWSIHSGDVKYHLGTSYDRPTRSGKRVHLSLMSNPSHLEAVNPLVEGKSHAKQFNGDKKAVLPLQLHGDAAFAGQGIVYETFQLSELTNYSTGGSIHIVVNNQIGFTTDPKDGRSTPYCTDVAKTFGVPVFHVNGDDSEAVVSVCRLAAEYRQQFGKSVIIDIVAYRRFGHNEVDNPFLTQPTLYSKITNHSSVVKLYQEQLKTEGILSQDQITEMKSKVDKELERAFVNAPSWKPKQSDWLESKWEGFKSADQLARISTTGFREDLLKKIGLAISSYPENMKLHRTLEKNMKEKRQMIESGEGIDWATAEALAFGTLLVEGNHVRLSGQDVERGTFSHRHSVIHDQETNETYVPLNHLGTSQAKFVVSNSSLNEYATLGFELGYSLESPNALVLWEAQFGDFANGAQIIIDQFLSCGEQKWHRMSGLVLLLPHGYDGNGPEHSSARLERFLQLQDSAPNEIPAPFNETMQAQRSNMQIVNITTPANYFHCLRRQLHRDFRKPLIVMSPKALLRDKRATSHISEMIGDSTYFKRVIGETKADSLVAPSKIRKVIFCSGQVYYTLATERENRKIKDIAIVRLEQIAPFPFDLISEQVKMYPNAQLMWCQEEPENMGAWHFVHPHFLSACKDIREPTISYVGRRVSASPAAGTYAQHSTELTKFVNHALE